MSGKGRESFREVWEGSRGPPTSLEGSEGPPGSLLRVERLSRKSRKGREVLPDVWKGSGVL